MCMDDVTSRREQDPIALRLCSCWNDVTSPPFSPSTTASKICHTDDVLPVELLSTFERFVASACHGWSRQCCKNTIFHLPIYMYDGTSLSTHTHTNTILH